MSAVLQGPARSVHLALVVLGYRLGPPAGVAEEALAVDREVAAGEACPRCTHPGLDFTPYHRGRSYRGVATCPACEYSLEL
jgi:hypothetical protein